MALLRSFATVGGLTAVSRVLGFIRDILIAAGLGSGPVADAFFVAFRFPNLFRRLFAEGAFNAAFVPLFSARLEQEGPEAARRFAGDVLSVMLSGLLLFTALCLALMPWIMQVIAPGFTDNSEKFALTVELTRIAFPYLLAMVITALLGGVLNSLYRFAAAAAAPIILNLFFIAALTVALPYFATAPGHVLAWTVTLAGLAQVIFLAVCAARAGMSLRLPRPRLTPGVRRLLALMVPGVLSAGVMQINLLIGTMIATLQAGAVSYLYYADRVYQLPLGILGIGIGVVLLPDLSRKLRAGSGEAARDSLNRALEYALLLTLPATFALALIPESLVAGLFQRGAFDDQAARATGQALAAFAIGLPSYVLVKLFQPAFFAREDTRTPFHLTVIAILANVVLSLLLFWQIGFVGIALATAISSWLHVVLLLVVLSRRGFLEPDRRLLQRCLRSLLASALMGGLLLFLAPLVSGWLELGPLGQAAALALLVGSGLAVYCLAALLLGAVTLAELKSLLRRRGRQEPPQSTA
ncbi:murein biosynthesis integral membrane protein MurJ [Fodinicurvata fenggangensis]|uniref:murein biosynthesis integral membrane protein MurJ n=1 Tax=Fodinicurvata fenggangensis TaxID=1121830 RepID=UPI00047DFAAE|nr:murein biosynthesis integral membrane protein MurJ [Fodinicurvata fenggangensis]